MKVEVRYFAGLVDHTGRTRDSLHVADDADVRELWRELVRRYPRLGDLGYRPLVACDLEYADWEQALAGVREVAFLPPLSGG